MQRIRVAMTGLALVILLIMIAGVIFNAVDRQAPVEAIGSSKSDVVANMTLLGNDVILSDEPLAELGVAPSRSSSDAAKAEPERRSAP